MIAAVSGITMERNTMTSKRNDKRTTRPMNSGSFSPRTWAKSAKIAVNPPTSTVVPDPASSVGIVTVRNRVSSSEVACAWGEVVG